MVQVSDQDMNTHLAEISRVSIKLETTFKCTVPDKNKAAELFVCLGLFVPYVLFCISPLEYFPLFPPRFWHS